MNTMFKNALAFTLTTSLAFPAFSAPFSVTPVRIYMTPKDKAIAVTVTNEGDEDLVMQADLYSWKQKLNGEDNLVMTEDLLLSPPIIKLAAKSRQVVRLARLRSVPETEQLTYRMIVREIPEAKPNTGNLQLQIAIAFSLPVFITPPKAKYKVNCTVAKSAADAVKATCENIGNAYAQIINFELASPDGTKLASRDTGGYILANFKRDFDIKSAEKSIPGGPAKLTIRLDDGTQQTFDVAVAE